MKQAGQYRQEPGRAPASHDFRARPHQPQHSATEGPKPVNEQEQRIDGPDILHARVYGDSIPVLKMAALDVARELYGPDAELRIEHVDPIQTAVRHSEGKFCTSVQVRCLNLPEEDR